MKLMIDSNIIIDYLANRVPFADDACDMFSLLSKGYALSLFTASAATGIYYIIRKDVGLERALEYIKRLLTILDVANVNRDDLLNAISLDFTDYEHALVSVCASRINAD